MIAADYFDNMTPHEIAADRMSRAVCEQLRTLGPAGAEASLLSILLPPGHPRLEAALHTALRTLE